ncbi:MAG: hypothetical protein HDT38_00260 [Clostridiales bacterium]|nr:hypothetical protein [Clostridiales bacterium]
MELRTTREMRRNEQLSRAMSKKAETADAPVQAQPSPKRQPATADKLTLSRQALSFLEEQDRKRWQWKQEREQRRQDRMSDSLSALESSKRELDAMGEKLKVLSKCQKIAVSIMKGNRVPPEDLEYLMNNDPEGYKLAMAMRRENPDPEDEKSVLDDEDRGGGRAEASGSGGESPSVEASAPSDSGGSAAPTAE